MESIVIIGNGMVGHQLVEQLVASGSHLEKRIIVIGEERFVAYDRVHLSAMFSGQSHQDLLLSSEEWYQKHGIELILGVAVVGIDRQSKRVTLEDESQLSYDQLVFATGSYPFVPPMAGSERSKVFVYRTLDDLSQIKQACLGAKKGAVIGGGLLGLEAANALRLLGLETHVVEFAPRLMPVQLDEGAGAVLKSKIEPLGLTVHTSTATEKIIDGETAYHRMVFKDAPPLEVDVIVFSAGIRPRDQLARDCGLELGERGGIVVNNACQTSDSEIYAIGECALWQGKIFGLVAPGYAMARVVAQQLRGGSEAEFSGADMSTKLKLLGVDVASIGDAHKATPKATEMVLHDAAAGIYKKLVVDQSGTTLLGAILIGDNQDYDVLLQSYLNKTPLPQPAVSLLFDASALKGDVSDNTVICSCHNVTKGDLISAIQAGAHELGELKAQTKASTGCGGCSAMVKSVLDQQLSVMGLEVNTQLCEHFSQTRQALYHICQVEKIRDFDSLLAKHGKGHGCDICKPTAGSIFSSLWNEHIMEPEHSPLQDSNDAFMANLQKDGSYSIVPRIPGGEITPEKLIVLGEVARQYDLYTKITGGQRVDLFGAQVEQLPEIWQTLIDAGFETGHAYGKSVRTVKSCVGSTWCRYGVDDSVGLAIELENRYKGLRAPHKLKFAVSGCTRECAEAQSKDIGVIATEKGWNLYVCGNGGMRPRHADLLAADLSKAELITLIDRVLMFYVRTADRLQRTSVWLENLDGGLDYLKSVVLDDSLHLCEQLEQQMAHVVDTYHCEWKQTLTNPEKLMRFRPFINSTQQSTLLGYQRTRGQRIPVKLED
ncbi:nitrite reductase large subunit [Vibrio vulnificus]|uniref:nitrite reductase large subunit NirB n=1 Tax=Vibrio vulnificus TaxID=672 RepID=UPI001CDB5A1E|nr:nitrite reductase large subunit NirB [Vibrio vulnificus]MCA3959721.1 nitrite reductase large subunit [Vibrio vulnificus]HDY7765487.1 nitrite reductase large subunit [Vibrio vulnificus]HDY7783066.1 nitrite reductase large subunit [Vibrio vulnificus]HDY7792752.1 nitrite reductase large subunit [Vibrio vulnificus]HDY7796854.1 nitrite reductase large subunit [Vibrio vulnificus]